MAKPDSDAASPDASPVAENVASTLAREIRELHGHKVLEFTDTTKKPQLIVLPDGKTVESLKPLLDEFLPFPERRKGTARFHDVESFIAHFNRLGDKESAVFAKPDKKKPSFTSVIDYHKASTKPEDANWLGHRAIYEPELSEEWLAWTARNGQPMSQGDFAAFIEDRIQDLVVADVTNGRIKEFAEVVKGMWAMPTELLELSRGLAVNVASVVKNAVTLQSGEISVQFDEQHRDAEGKPIRVPNLFQLAIPVFYAGTAYRIAVRLRYRVSAGTIQWHYNLVRHDLVFEDAFKGIVAKIDEGVQGEVFLGSPEAQ